MANWFRSFCLSLPFFSLSSLLFMRCCALPHPVMYVCEFIVFGYRCGPSSRFERVRSRLHKYAKILIETKSDFLPHSIFLSLPAAYAYLHMWSRIGLFFIWCARSMCNGTLFLFNNFGWCRCVQNCNADCCFISFYSMFSFFLVHDKWTHTHTHTI